MSLISDLAGIPGVIAAGEYSYRGDRFSFKGQLDEEKARMASIMCRATTMGVHMETDIMNGLYGYCGVAPSRGWAVRGPQFSVCVIANVFCFIDNNSGSLNQVMGVMRERLADVSDALV